MLSPEEPEVRTVLGDLLRAMPALTDEHQTVSIAGPGSTVSLLRSEWLLLLRIVFAWESSL